tara:strand:- start:50 stop:298 length:249 start_codon:yes stop_codon:yes gene_type:complete
MSIGLAEVGQLGEESLGHEFMFPDFFFVRAKSLSLLNTSCPGKGHGMKNPSVQLKEELGTESYNSLITIDPSIRTEGTITTG